MYTDIQVSRRLKPFFRHEPMTRDLFSRYVWIIDTLTRYGRLSRERLGSLWLRSSISNGQPLPERTFFHYRRSIEQNFHIDINCDESGQYYIDQASLSRNRSLTNLMLDNYAVNGAISDSPDASDRVEVEDVPSAREFLPLVLEAIRNSEKVCFTYAGFNRSRAERDIIFSPYFLKRYKQRWYMLGRREKDGGIRTYALDRIKALTLTQLMFTMPEGLTAADYFGSVIGITTSHAPIYDVRLRASSRQAKYMRALPMHHSQQEEIHDDYSIFSYRLQLNYELVHEIISFGDTVKVIDPPELRVMVTEGLRSALSQYEPISHD